MRTAMQFNIALWLASAACLAGGGGGFAAHKQKMLADIQARQQALTDLQGCVQAANNHAELKTCEQKHKATLARIAYPAINTVAWPNLRRASGRWACAVSQCCKRHVEQRA